MPGADETLGNHSRFYYARGVPKLPSNVTRLLKGVDDETGASVTVEDTRRPGRTKARKAKRMSMVNVDAMVRLELTMQEHRILWCLLSHVPARSGTVAYAHLAQIAEETGIHPVNVSKVMKGMRDRRIVETLRLGQHHVNANIAYSGSFDDWNDADVMELEPIWTRHGVDPVTGEVL